MIETGEIGRVYHMQGAYEYGRIHKIVDGWRGDMDYYSVVLGGGVHMIDLFIWLVGERPVEVFAYGNNISTRNTDFRFDDLVVSVMKFESGLVTQLTANYACVHPHFHPLDVYGDKGTFKNGMHGGKYFASRDFDTEPEEITEAYPGTHKGDLIDSFVGSITGDSRAEVTIDEVFDSVSVCFAIDESARTGKPVEVRYI
jgi:predicted dehydrogenase